MCLPLSPCQVEVATSSAEPLPPEAVARLQAVGGGSAPADDPRRGSQGEGHRLRAVAGAREQGASCRLGWDATLVLGCHRAEFEHP